MIVDYPVGILVLHIGFTQHEPSSYWGRLQSQESSIQCLIHSLLYSFLGMSNHCEYIISGYVYSGRELINGWRKQELWKWTATTTNNSHHETYATMRNNWSSVFQIKIDCLLNTHFSWDSEHIKLGRSSSA